MTQLRFPFDAGAILMSALVGPDYSPQDVLHLISRIIELPGVVGFDIGMNVVIAVQPDSSRRSGITSRSYLIVAARCGVDLTLWLHDIHDNVTAWHHELRSKITDEQRAAVLRIKDVWFRLPSLPRSDRRLRDLHRRHR